jgi:diaminopimelate decarboxylase
MDNRPWSTVYCPLSMVAMNRISLFPDTTKIEHDSLTIAGHTLSALAEQYGTPLYIYDRATLDNAVAAYKFALAKHYPGRAEITYAGKAFLCLAIAQWTQEHHLWLDCTGEGELAIARAANPGREHILVHGVNKSPADLASAIQHAGTIVVDNLTELNHIIRIFTALQPPLSTPRFPAIWLRLQPGRAVDTHIYTQTGGHESKFGMPAQELCEAAALCRMHHLPLRGIHFHQGSQFKDAGPLKEAIELAFELAKEIRLADEWAFSPGGGWGVAYHEDDLPGPDIEAYVRFVAQGVVDGCRKHGLTLPRLHVEPGRSLIARAGVAVYRVGTVKRRGSRTWLLADGGMADNPRHALYGARYSALPLAGLGRGMNRPVSIAGPYCESGDVLIEDLLMPDIAEGEWIAVPVSGAYHLSMSGNYNGARRPAVVLLEADRARLIQRRETDDDLLKRDLGL